MGTTAVLARFPTVVCSVEVAPTSRRGTISDLPCAVPSTSTSTADTGGDEGVNVNVSGYESVRKRKKF